MSKLRPLSWSTALAVTVSLMTVSLMALSLMLARVHPFGDAGLFSGARAGDPVQAQAGIPGAVGAMLNQKCADCHSSETHAPLYGRVAPVSWLLERDIVEGRAAMNLSKWASYTPEQQEVLKSKILQQTKSGKMPLLQYRVIHWSARLSPADIQTLSAWVHAAPASDGERGTAVAGDAMRGEAVFEKRCSGCHALTTDREGPRLQGVYGRRTAAVHGFPYSAALQQANVIWNEENLERWLTDPDSLIANSNMDFRVAKPQERKDVIAYLRSMTER